MKYAVLFSVCFFLVVTAAHGETMYVTDVVQVMVRTGPDLEHKIISMPKSGTPLDVLEVVDEWSRVRLPSQKEGWMLSQFLVPGPPTKGLVAELKSQNEALTIRSRKLSEENTRLKEERKELTNALSKRTETAKSLEQSYNTLKEEYKEFLSLKASYGKAAKELAAKKKQLAELEKELETLRKGQTLHWFLGGAGVILVGFVIGFVSRRSRRRTSLL
jgi:SH3 domain protein